MANLFLTNKCNRACKFCFAKQGPWSESYKPRELTIEEVNEYISYLPAGVHPEQGLLGGEPFSYSQIDQIIELLWDKELIPKIFTNGTYPLPKSIASLDLKKGIQFVCNVSRWGDYSDKERINLDKFLRTFHQKISLAYTILNPDDDLTFLLDYVDNYNLIRSIRLGISLPIPGDYNEYLLQDKYREVAVNLIGFARRAAKRYISFGADCGFVACMFESEEYGLMQMLDMKLRFSCGPVLDVGPDLETWHCFPLAKLPKLSLRKLKSLLVAGRLFKDMGDKIRNHYGDGIYKRCSSCRYKSRGQCSGGCLGFLINPKDDFDFLIPNESLVIEKGDVTCQTSC